MRYRYLLLGAMAIVVIGCDSRYRSRIFVSLPANSSSTSIVAAVDEYSKEHGLSCSPHPGTLVHCYKQPVRVFATLEPNGVSVCYSAMGIPAESTKFESRISQLKAMLVSRVGESAVTTTQPHGRQCVLPQ